MAQADQVVQNASFPTVRADINDNLAALFSQSSGQSAPAITVAYQPWIDTSSSPAVWKVRNAANNGWITVGVLDPTGFSVSGVTQIANGGTGATNATAALTALLPTQSGQSGKALVTNGTAASWGNISAGARFELFTSSTTWICPGGVEKVNAIVVGGGGGGGGGYILGGTSYAGGSGGFGGIGIGTTIVTPGQSYTVTVGAGGVGGAANSPGTAGGSSIFSTITATGGGGGSGSGSGGASGTCVSTDATIRRSNVGLIYVPFIGALSTSPGSGTAAKTWTISSSFSPGSNGGSGVGSGSGTGGSSGAILIIY